MAKMEYSLETLWKDIQDIPEENEGKERLGDKVEREFQSKLIVMHMLMDLASKYWANDYNEEENLRKVLELEVIKDELLSGYIFFIPQNPQFDYTWSYMRKRKKVYVEFLVNAVMFLKKVLLDINILADKLRRLGNVHFVFNDIFDVALIAERPHVKTGLRWENFYRIAATKESYNVVVKKGEVVLMARDRKDVSDVDGVIDVVLQMVNDKKLIFD